MLPWPKDTYSSSVLRELAKGRLRKEASGRVKFSRRCPELSAFRMRMRCASQMQHCIWARQEMEHFHVLVSIVREAVRRNFCRHVDFVCQVGIDARHHCEAVQGSATHASGKREFNFNLTKRLLRRCWRTLLAICASCQALLSGMFWLPPGSSWLPRRALPKSGRSSALLPNTSLSDRRLRQGTAT